MQYLKLSMNFVNIYFLKTQEDILLRLSILGVLPKAKGAREREGIFSEKGKFKEREFR